MGAGDPDLLIPLLEGPLFLFFDLLPFPALPLPLIPCSKQRGGAVTHADGDQVLVDT